MMQGTKKFFASVVVLTIIFFTNQAISENIKLNPIKPNGQTKNLTDEQQAILAVRKAKASVVNIVGFSKASTNTQVSGGLTVNAVPIAQVSGTGFVVEADGLIVTNNHVVEDPDYDYMVILSDGTKYPAKVTGLDKFDDLAFLKTEAGNLTPAVLGDSDALETGQTVFAIGNSLGRYQNTVTRGVVSGLGRLVNDFGDGVPRMHNLIQTDAAINPGNSGGPLINMAGEVVGVNTLIDTAGSGLGFTIPIKTVKDSLSQLKTFGKVVRPYLGITFQTVDSMLQLSSNLPVANGALISSVVAGSPAESAGLKPDDIIVSINGEALTLQNELDTVVQKYQAGNQLMLKVLRNGKSLDLPLILGQFQ